MQGIKSYNNMEILETQKKTYLTPITRSFELGYRTSPICASVNTDNYKVDDDVEFDWFMKRMSSSHDSQEKYISPECDELIVSLESVCASSSVTEDTFGTDDYIFDEDIFISILWN